MIVDGWGNLLRRPRSFATGSSKQQVRTGTAQGVSGKAVERAGSGGLQDKAARAYLYARTPAQFPHAPGKRISGQMARFTVFQKKSPANFALTGPAHIRNLR